MIVFELIEEGQLLDVKHCSCIATVQRCVIITALIGRIMDLDLLVQDDDWKDVRSAREVSARTIYVDVLQELAQALHRPNGLLHLPFELPNLHTLRHELSIQQQEISKQFGKVVISCFNFFSKGLLMMLV